MAFTVNPDQVSTVPAGSTAVTSLPALPAGANAIGTVGVTSLPALPAGANAIGTVGVTSGPVQGTPRNSTATSAANVANAVTIAAVAGQQVHFAGLDYFTSAGTATLTIADGATTIFSGPASAARTLLLGFPGLAGTVGNAMTVTVGAAGVGNTSTLNIIASQY